MQVGPVIVETSVSDISNGSLNDEGNHQRSDEEHSQDRNQHAATPRSEEHTSELQSHSDLVCRLLLEKKKKRKKPLQ